MQWNVVKDSNDATGCVAVEWNVPSQIERNGKDRDRNGGTNW
jgi:hypothetical protein